MPDHIGLLAQFRQQHQKSTVDDIPGGPEVLRISQRFLKVTGLSAFAGNEAARQISNIPASLGEMNPGRFNPTVNKS
jgi:hypothetical protein